MADLTELLEELPENDSTLLEDQEEIADSVEDAERHVVEDKDYAEAFADFSQWLLALVKAEPIPPTVKALCFALNEPDGDFGLYLTGSTSYDADDPEWVAEQTYLPKGRQFTLDLIAKLPEELEGAQTAAWEIAQVVALAVVKAFFREHCNDFVAASGIKQAHIACGFEDGDMYAVPTAITPAD